MHSGVCKFKQACVKWKIPPNVALVASERTGEIKENSSDILLILHLWHASDMHHVQCFEQNPRRGDRDLPMRHVAIVDDSRLTIPELLTDADTRQHRDMDFESICERLRWN